MNKTKQGLRNLNDIKSTQRNPRVVGKYVKSQPEPHCDHNWSGWQYEGDGNFEDDSYYRYCTRCKKEQHKR